MSEADTITSIATARAKADKLRAELAAVLGAFDADAPDSAIMRNFRRMESLRQQLELTGQ